MAVGDRPGQIGRLGQVLAVDQVADAAYREAEHHAEHGSVGAGRAWELLAQAVEPTAESAADDCAVDRDAALGEPEDVDEAVDRGAVAVILGDVEGACADDAAGDHDHAQGVGGVGVDVDAIRRGDADGQPDARR